MARISSSALKKLWRLGPGGWWLLIQAQVELAFAARLVGRVPQGELVESLAERYTVATSVRADFARAEEVGLAIDRVARFGFGRPLCLVRSIALHRLLEGRGIPGSRIRVGVRMGRRGFEAHAWVELEGRIVGDNPEYIERFNRLSELTVHAASAEGIS